MGYIYKITNNINGKMYIGKTERSVNIRYKEHLRNINKYCDSIPLYKALKKYGKENFTIEQIEECSNDLLDQREIYWISTLDTYHNGYNCTIGGEGGIKDYHEHINEIIFRYNKGERLDLLCKEFHYGYSSIRPKLIEHGLKIDTNAGPKKLSVKIQAIDPKTKEIIMTYDSISQAARDICENSKNFKFIANHISKYKDTSSISHGYLWKTVKE